MGAHLLVGLQGRRYDVVGTDRNPWWGDVPVDFRVGDLSDPEFLKSLIRSVRPELLIHCAALVDVEACERRPEEASRINGKLPGFLAGAAGDRCRVVFLSTDSVFSGEKAFSSEEDLPSPRNAYASSKREGEEQVQRRAPHCLILRTNFYGWSSGRKKTSAEWMVRSLQTQQPMTLFEDLFFTPIYVPDLVEGLIRLLECQVEGIFHLGGRDRVSKYQFGQLLAEELGVSMDRVQRGSVERAGFAAERPRDISLNSQRYCEITGADLPGCREGIRRFAADGSKPLSQRFQCPVLR